MLVDLGLVRAPVGNQNSAGSGLALALLCLAQFIVILDITIVKVALPSIQADLGFGSQAGLQYVISLYALTFGGSLILAGRAADLVGRRRVFIIGLALLAAASLRLTGVSPDGAYTTGVLPGFAPTGLGLGIAFVTVTIAAVVAVATAHTAAASGSPTQRLVAGSSTGYLLDAALAGLAAVLAVVLIRTKPHRRVASRSCSGSGSR